MEADIKMVNGTDTGLVRCRHPKQARTPVSTAAIKSGMKNGEYWKIIRTSRRENNLFRTIMTKKVF